MSKERKDNEEQESNELEVETSDQGSAGTSDLVGSLELPETVHKVQDFVVSNYKLIVGGIAAIVIAVIGLVWYNNSQAEAQEVAALKLSRLAPYLEGNNFKQLVDGEPGRTIRGDKIVGAKELASQYGSTAAGKVAALYAAIGMVAEGKYGDALPLFEQASGSESPLVKAGGFAGLGACFEEKQNFAKAAESYQNAAKQLGDGAVSDRYTLYAALAFEKSGNTQEASKLFTAITKRPENTDFQADAKAGLTRLGMKIE